MSSFDLAYTKTLDLEIFKEIGKVSEYLCPLCTGVYYNPVVDHCGHVFCRECIKYWLGSIGKTKICPISKTQYDSNIEDQIIHPLTVIQIIIEKLEVKCKNRCDWEGKLSEMFPHIRDKCPNSIIDCRNKIDGCAVSFIRTDRVNHEDVCEFRPSQCENCEKSVPIVSMPKHLEICPKVRVECPQSCIETIERAYLDAHVKNDCKNTRVSCVFAGLGCDQNFLRSSQRGHDVDNIDKHNRIVVSSLIETKQKLEKVMKTMDEFNQNLFVLTNNMNSNSITESMYEQLIDSYNKKGPDDFMSSDVNLHANNLNNINNRGTSGKILSRASHMISSKANNNQNVFNQRDSTSSSGEKKKKFTTGSLTQKKRERNLSATASYDKANSANYRSVLTSNLQQYPKNTNKIVQSGLLQQDDQTATDDLEEFMSINSNGLINKGKPEETQKFSKTNYKTDTQTQQAQLTLDNVNISKGVVVTNNRALNNSMNKNEHKFIFANLSLNKTDVEWKVVINKKSSWIGVGCCIKETVISSNYKFASHMKPHGCFMISSNGYMWNTNNPNENNSPISSSQSTTKFEIETGDIIKFAYKCDKNELTASLREYKINLTSVYESRDAHLVPCVVLLNYGDEVTFTY